MIIFMVIIPWTMITLHIIILGGGESGWIRLAHTAMGWNIFIVNRHIFSPGSWRMTRGVNGWVKNIMAEQTALLDN
jgi:hypothetical protein